MSKCLSSRSVPSVAANSLSSDPQYENKKKWREENREKYNESVRKWKRNNKGKTAARHTEYYRRVKNEKPEAFMVSAARARAKRKGLDFDITVDDVEIPETCPVLGIPLFKSEERLSPNSPSLDRIDSSKGYIRGNVHVISWRANTLKNDATVEELKSLYEFFSRLASQNV